MYNYSSFKRMTLLLCVLLLVAGNAFFTRQGQRRAWSQIPAARGEQSFPTVPLPFVTPDTSLNVHLLEAVQQGDVEAARSLLAQGASADARVYWQGKEGSLPLILLAARDMKSDRTRFLPLFRLLIVHVTDPNASDGSGRTLLMAAVDMDDIQSVKRLVHQGADVNAVTKGSFAGASALYFAVMQSGNRDKNLSPITRFLLAQGTNVNCQNGSGDTPLMVASQFGKITTVKALLAQGADPSLRNQRGWTALRWASLTGKEDIVQILGDITPMDLLEAAQFGKETRVRAHLDAGESPNTSDAVGITPLMAAMKSQSAPIVTLLLDRGAVLEARDKSGRTALHHAALFGNTTLARLLLERGADINAVSSPSRSTNSLTPLLCAVSQSEADMVDLLLTRGVDLAQNEQGALALEQAVRMAGQRPRRPREAPAHAQDQDAFLDAQAKIVVRLLAAGADVRSHHSRALYIAAFNAQLGLITLLLAKGADVNARNVEGSLGSEDEGETALMGAMMAWSIALSGQGSHKKGGLPGLKLQGSRLKSYASREETAQAHTTVMLLLGRGANINAADRNGKTPLMQCQASGLLDLAKTLLARQADVNAIDYRGRTALMQAAVADDLPMAQLLLAHGAAVNQRDNAGCSTLMLAIYDGSNETFKTMQAEENEHLRTVHHEDPPPISRKDLPNPEGHPAMVSLLLRHKADVNAATPEGTTALHLAQKNDFKRIVILLQHAGAK